MNELTIPPDVQKLLDWEIERNKVGEPATSPRLFECYGLLHLEDFHEVLKRPFPSFQDCDRGVQKWRTERMQNCWLSLTKPLMHRAKRLYDRKGLLLAQVKDPSMRDARELHDAWKAQGEDLVEVYDQYQKLCFDNYFGSMVMR